jgi:hypothetical protein
LTKLGIDGINPLIASHGLFMYQPMIANHLITLCAQRDVASIIKIVTINPLSMLEKINFRGPCGKTYSEISPFMYLASIYDLALLKRVVKLIPSEEKSTVLEQLEALDALSFGESIYFDFTAIINAYQMYVNNYGLPSSEFNAKTYWNNQVEPELAKLPHHISLGCQYPRINSESSPPFCSALSSRIMGFLRYSVATYKAIPVSYENFYQDTKTLASLLFFGKSVPREGNSFRGFPGEADARVDLAYLTAQAKFSVRNLAHLKNELRNTVQKSQHRIL